MKAVTFTNENTTFDAFIFQESEHTVTIASDVLGRWIHRLEKRAILDQTVCDVVYRPLFEVKERVVSNEYKHAWMFEFSIKEEDFPKLYYMAKFFEMFISLEQLPLTKRIERSIECVEIFLSKGDLLSRLICFILSKHDEPKERIRLLVSEKINQYSNI